MKNAFKAKYKIDKKPIEKAYETQIGLKQNKEYEEMTDKACIQILNYFSIINPNVSIEIPKAREKSSKSILGKIKNLQIERLSKLYAIEGLDKKEIEELYELIRERVYELEEQKNTKKSIYILKNIYKLLNTDIEKLDIDSILESIMIEEISKSTKTALLRILVSKIENSNIENKKEILEKLDFKYGKKASQISKVPEDDIIRYSSIQEIRKDKKRVEILHDENRYLKAKDLRGMKIVITDIEKFENKKIQKPSERIIDKHKSSMKIADEFIEKLYRNKELLSEIGIRVMPYSIKHKKKTNGYEANHIKFEFIDKTEYTFELQIKSEYIEELSKGEGSASHENRPGKQRVIPSSEKEEEFIKQIQYNIPKYTLFRNTSNGYEKYKCNLLQNAISYYQNQIQIDSEEYEKINSIIKTHMENKEKE